MWTLIPRPIRQYRRENPYNNPVLFWFLDCIDATLKFAIVGGAMVAVYLSMTGESGILSNAISASDQVQKTTPVSLADSALQTTVIAASANLKPAVTEATSQKVSARTLLDNKHAVQWIKSLPESHYVIQYAASTDKGTLIAFANAHLQKGAVIYPFKITTGNNAMYGVASGLYDSLHAALLAIDKLPVSLQQHSPWVRPVSELQSDVSKTFNHPSLRTEYAS